MSNNLILRLSINNLSFSYYKNSERIEILKNISFDVLRNSIVGIAGKSGCGKTTLGKIIANYFKNSNLFNYELSGKVIFDQINNKIESSYNQEFSKAVLD